jgi:hypothetical protein
MSNTIISKTIAAAGAVLVLLVVTGIAATGTGTGTSRNTPVALEAYGLHQRDAIAVRSDPVRGRLWVLSLDSLRIYDTATRKPLRELELPSWYITDGPCAPDLMLDGSGSAFVSSNVVPQLWRIDATTFEVTVVDITLRGREHWDLGFAALRLTSAGTLRALSSNANSVWAIDVSTGSAEMIEAYAVPSSLCGSERHRRDQARAGQTGW